MTRYALIGTLLLIACVARTSHAHEVRPAYLELKQVSPDTFDVLWKVPAMGDELRMGLYVRFPESCETVVEPHAMFVGDAYLERWQIRHAAGLVGESIVIDGLKTTLTDVLVRVERLDGSTQVTRLMPETPAFVVEATPSPLQVAGTYLVLGIEHILLGLDHLLFILGLVLLVKGWRQLVSTITAFTIAHSLTLAAATMGWVHVPSAPVEACIALSIVFVASEIVRSRQGTQGLTERAPWCVAFTFGLLHGLGFAGALSEVGLPADAIPIALLFFNVGVEIGQLAFVAVVLMAAALLQRLPLRQPTWAWRLLPYAIGTVAMFWVFERTAAF